MFTVMTCMLITVDREASLINNREPWTELRVIRVDKEYFNITFLGYSRNIKADSVEKILLKLRGGTRNTKDKNSEEWQETVLV